MKSVDVARAAQITFRQLDYWCSAGYLHPDSAHPGIGNDRRFTVAEARVAVAIARLQRAGLTLETAHRVARGETEIADGVEVFVDRDRHPDGPSSREIRRAAVLMSRKLLRSPKAKLRRAQRAGRKVVHT